MAGQPVEVLLRTTAIFAGVTGKGLALLDGPTPGTDGVEITVPFSSPHAYDFLEKELSYVAMGSDGVVRDAFLTEYTDRVYKLAAKHEVPIHVERLSGVLADIYDALEHHRVLSLWRGIYPGSHARLISLLRTSVQTQLAKSEGELPLALCLLSTAADVSWPRQEDHIYQAYVAEALHKVDRRWVRATLLTARWLVSSLVGQIIRESLGLPPPDLTEEKGHPKQIQSTPREKLEALQTLVHKLGRIPEGVRKDMGGVSPPIISDPTVTEAARREAEQITRTNTNDSVAVQEGLSLAETEASEHIETLVRTLQSVMNKEAWLSSGQQDHVRFVDRAVSGTKFPLSKHDRTTVARLRNIFQRLQGRVTQSLDDTGYEVDISAWIDRHVSKQHAPVFKHDTTGRGFRCLLLLDRSASMAGNKTLRAERAYTLLSEALRFPYVSAEVWGFNSPRYGEVTLYRGGMNLGAGTTFSTPVEGYTPLHIAIGVAAKHLRLSDDVKVLFVVSDGLPEYVGKDGHVYGGAQMVSLVREQVRLATDAGVRVVGVFIDDLSVEDVLVSSVAPEVLASMFGPPRNWKIVSDSNLGSELVELVSTTFVDYLRSR